MFYLNSLFSLSGKIDNQIPSFPYAVATLLTVITLYNKFNIFENLFSYKFRKKHSKVSLTSTDRLERCIALRVLNYHISFNFIFPNKVFKVYLR